LQVQQLATPSACVRGNVDEREQPLLLRGVEERSELGNGPYGSRLLALCSWSLGTLHGVAGDEFAHDDGISECLVQHRVQVSHGRDSEWLTVTTSAGQ
jgi:hypothetical protein